MQRVNEDLKLLERKRASATETFPADFAGYLRSQGDVFYWEPGKFWIVTNHEVARKAFRDPVLSCDRRPFFLSRMPNLDLRYIPKFLDTVTRMMVMSDAPEHGQRRGVAAKPFTEALVANFRPIVDRAVATVLERLPGEGRIDFMTEIGRYLPSAILADIFSIPAADREGFYRWSINMTQFFGGASQYRNQDGIEVNESTTKITEYFKRVLADRRRSPGTDLLSQMMEMNGASGLSDEDLIAQAVMMVVAGQVTTTDQIANNVFTLLSRPGLLARLQANPERIPTAMEELNRWDPGVTFLFRVANAPTQLGSASIPSGAVVFISNHAVNRDPLVFERAGEIDLSRSPNPHMAYGFGAHFCLGAPLARIQMQALFRGLLGKFATLRLSDSCRAVRDHYSLAFSGFQTLPLELRSHRPHNKHFTTLPPAFLSAGERKAEGAH